MNSHHATVANSLVPRTTQTIWSRADLDCSRLHAPDDGLGLAVEEDVLLAAVSRVERRRHDLSRRRRTLLRHGHGLVLGSSAGQRRRTETAAYDMVNEHFEQPWL